MTFMMEPCALLLSCRFSRTIKGSNFDKDFDLDDDYYLLFGTGQTPRG